MNPGTSFQRNGRSGLRRERYNINNKNDYERECFEFGDGYHRNCRNDVRGRCAFMHLNAHKIKFCLHMSKNFSNFVPDFKDIEFEAFRI